MPSSTSPTSLSTISPELLSHILYFAIAPSSLHGLNLLTVCNDFHILGRPHLLSTVSLRSEKGWEGIGRETFSARLESGAEGKEHRWMIFDNVREFQIHFCPGERNLWIPTFVLETSTHRPFPNLRKVLYAPNFSFNQARNFPIILGSFSPSQLEITSLLYGPALFTHLADPECLVEDLTCPWGVLAHRQITGESVQCWSVRSLTLVYSGTFGSRFRNQTILAELMEDFPEAERIELGAVSEMEWNDLQKMGEGEGKGIFRYKRGF